MWKRLPNGPLFSPRAWGWSVDSILPAHPLAVLPTRVGMVRRPRGLLAIAGGSPHARGDGPAAIAMAIYLNRFSPRAWGWSEDPTPRWNRSQVLPTRVGMVRTRVVRQRGCGGSPHARGDGPDGLRLSSRSVSSPHARGDGPGRFPHVCCDDMFSPRAWGWSVLTNIDSLALDVLPTRVGMVRRRPGGLPDSRSSPHARGDGPYH